MEGGHHGHPPVEVDRAAQAAEAAVAELRLAERRIQSAQEWLVWALVESELSRGVSEGLAEDRRAALAGQSEALSREREARREAEAQTARAEAERKVAEIARAAEARAKDAALAAQGLAEGLVGEKEILLAEKDAAREAAEVRSRAEALYRRLTSQRALVRGPSDPSVQPPRPSGRSPGELDRVEASLTLLHDACDTPCLDMGEPCPEGFICEAPGTCRRDDPRAGALMYVPAGPYLTGCAAEEPADCGPSDGGPLRWASLPEAVVVQRNLLELRTRGDAPAPDPPGGWTLDHESGLPAGRDQCRSRLWADGGSCLGKTSRRRQDRLHRRTSHGSNYHGRRSSDLKAINLRTGRQKSEHCLRGCRYRCGRRWSRVWLVL